MRTRIAAGLHDRVGASLSRIAILSEVARQQAETAAPNVVPTLASIGDNAGEVVDDMSDAIWFIDPAVADVQELLARLRTVAASLFEPEVGWRVEAEPATLVIQLTNGQRRHLFLIAKEALTNVRRHARATAVEVRMTIAGGRIGLEIVDDGVGMPEAAQRRAGRGITSMLTRAAELGGRRRSVLLQAEGLA